MMTMNDKELKASILRYYHAEQWKVGTIAKQLNVHHSIVTRVLAEAGIPKATLFPRAKSLLSTFLSYVQETLKKFPTLTASRLYQMVKTRGYEGGPDHFRHQIALHRPRKHAEAYLRLRTLPGEQAQVDWGHFGSITIGRAKRPLMAFVMVLSYSRKIFLRFYLNQKTENFLRGHEAALKAFQGVPRVILYDNLKAAVVERQGDAIRFNSTLLDFAAHYRYEPRPVAVARGNEKGRVERAIRYIRDNFFAAREWKDIDDLNALAEVWCEGQAADRPCPEDTTITVREAFAQEQPKLFRLPETDHPTHEREEVSVGKTPYVRFDLNDYSVPHDKVHRLLTVHATLDKVTILDGMEVVAEHPRNYGKGEEIENETHVKELVERKKAARVHRGQNYLTHAIPSCQALLNQAAERGYSLRAVTSQLLQLLESYSANEIETAVQEALSRGVPHPNTVRLSLEKRCEERQQLPPINLDLPQDKRVRELVIRPHNLEDYDQLQLTTEENIDE